MVCHHYRFMGLEGGCRNKQLLFVVLAFNGDRSQPGHVFNEAFSCWPGDRFSIR